MPLLRPDTVTTFRPLPELVPAHWLTGSTAARDGIQLHWTDTGGDGPALLLLHGIQVDGMTWLRTARALESRYRVIMPDFRGHGRSGGPRDQALPDAFIDDLRVLIAALSLRRPAAIGHSMGAEVAGLLAAVEDLDGVVLVDPPLHRVPGALQIDLDAPPLWLRRVFDSLRALKTQSHAERMVTGLDLLPPGDAPEWHEADYVTYVEGQARCDLDLYRHMADAAPVAERPDVIAAIRCPILLLTARPMLPGADVDDAVASFARHWHDGRHVHFPDSGHAIPVEQFDRFLAVVTDFLDERLAGRG